MKKFKYLTAEEIIAINKEVLKNRIKKADQHEVLVRSRIDGVVEKCNIEKQDGYNIAVCLLKDLIHEHPFASGNRRTAWSSMGTFAKENNLKINVDNSGKQARILQGIRENRYTESEIKNWLMIGKIKKFER